MIKTACTIHNFFEQFDGNTNQRSLESYLGAWEHAKTEERIDNKSAIEKPPTKMPVPLSKLS